MNCWCRNFNRGSATGICIGIGWSKLRSQRHGCH